MDHITELKEFRAKNNYDKAHMARLFGVEWQNYHNWEARNSLPKKYFARAEEILMCPKNQVEESSSNAEYYGGVDTWDSDTPLSQDEVSLPFYTEVEASAGTGQFRVQENHGPKLRFSKSTLSRYNISPENAACIKVKGNSMEPVLPDGATVGVDTASTSIIDGKMFAIDHDGMLRVKMLYRMPGGGIRFRSYNSDEHPDEQYTGDDLQYIRIIGRVFWSSVLY
jgi:phage repressor protein C with HTH and peptisase S24 domain/DNA-binding XRE family transcriptional regulator